MEETGQRNIVDHVLDQWGIDKHAFGALAEDHLKREMESVQQATEKEENSNSGDAYVATAEDEVFLHSLLSEFDRCGKSMEQLTATVNDIRIDQRKGRLCAGTSFNTSEINGECMLPLTNLLADKRGFWDVALTMQNEVSPQDISPLVVSSERIVAKSKRASAGKMQVAPEGIFSGAVEEHGLRSALSIFDGDYSDLMQALRDLDAPSPVEQPLDEGLGQQSAQIDKLGGKLLHEEGKVIVTPDESSPVVKSVDTPTSSADVLIKPGKQTATSSQVSSQDQVGSSIRHGSLWDDLAVTQLKPARQVTVQVSSCIDEYDHSEEGTALRLLALQLGEHADRPANLPRLLALTALAVGAVAFSTWYVRAAVTSGAAESAGLQQVLQHPRMLSVLWVAAFAANLGAVSVPGRLDRMYAEKVHLKPWQSMFEPSNWAFAIWGVIYLSEAVATVSVLWAMSSGGEASGLRTVVGAMLPAWVAGNCAQALWCFVFRPEFSSKLYIPTLCLAVGTGAYFAAHQLATAALLGITTACTAAVTTGTCLALPTPHCRLLAFLRSALAMLCMWILFCTVITLNSWITVSYGIRMRGLQISAGFLSAFFVATVGCVLSVYAQDPLFALTTAWAMHATAHRSNHKATMMPTAGGKKAVSADVHESLAGVESLLAVAALTVAAGVVLWPAVQGVASLLGVVTAVPK